MSRSSKKGPWVEERLMARVEELNTANSKKMLRTWSRRRLRPYPGRSGTTFTMRSARARAVGIK